MKLELSIKGQQMLVGKNNTIIIIIIILIINDFRTLRKGSK